MSTVLKIGYQRELATDPWPQLEFIDLFISESIPSAKPWDSLVVSGEFNPLMLGFWMPHLINLNQVPKGFQKYDYDEYDPSMDYILNDLAGAGFKHLVGHELTLNIGPPKNKKLAYNPSSLVWNQNFTFDNIDSVNEFIERCWEDFQAPNILQVKDYLAEHNMKITQRCYDKDEFIKVGELFS